MTTQTRVEGKCKTPLSGFLLPAAVALIVPTASFLVMWGTITNKIDANAEDIEKNGAAIASTPSTFVPRRELDAKLENIQIQIGQVQANVEELREQSERQTAEIIRKIERVADERRVVTP